jgi:hypothetical protein
VDEQDQQTRTRADAFAEDLAARTNALKTLEAELHELADELARRSEQLVAREHALAEHEASLRTRSEEGGATVASAPAAAPTAPAPRVDRAASVSFPELEFLVRAYGDSFPERREEWGVYLDYLRAYADADGRLPLSFEGLISDVFLPLDSLSERERELVRRAVGPQEPEAAPVARQADGGRDWAYYERLLEAHTEPEGTAPAPATREPDAPSPRQEPAVSVPREPLAIPSGAATELTKGYASMTLPALERLVADNEDEFPEHVKEWNYYLYYLREYAEPDGRFPAYFQTLVESIFERVLPR